MRRLTIGIGIFAGLLLAAPVAAKAILEGMAGDAARRFAAPAAGIPDVQSKALHVAARVHEVYRATQGATDTPWLFRVRPYLTHQLLPNFLRVEDGAIEALLIEGVCDSAARATVYVLNEIGIRAEQLNIIGRQGEAHSIVRAYREDGTSFLADPLYGVAPMRDGVALDAETAQGLQRGGMPAGEVWRSIAAEPRYHPVYDAFQDVWLSRQGEPFAWEVTLALGPSGRLALGGPDGDYHDIVDAGAQSGLTVYWHYLGHRYDRGWTRTLTVRQPTRITFFLIEDVREGVITTDMPPDEVAGAVVRYDLDAGASLRFHDGRATRDWLSLTSYQDVDYIVFERL